jgi:hypothetical protein
LVRRLSPLSVALADFAGAERLDEVDLGLEGDRAPP